jgi:hypothetical protein
MADPTLTAALTLDGVYFFGAVKLEIPGRDICLLDGAGEVTIAGQVYKGLDHQFGTLNSIDTISEALGDEAPELLLSLYPVDGVSASVLANPAMQGSKVTIMVGAIDPMTGLPIGTPEVKFLGEIDVPTLTISQGERVLEFTLVSVFEKLFEVEEGVRATDGFHQSIWPGEKGFEYMTGTDKNLYWGGKKPTGVLSVGGGSFADRAGGGLVNER